jgi:hypothetical protein
MPLYLPNGHATGVQRQDLVVKISSASLVLGHDLRVKTGTPVTVGVDGQLAKVAFEGLLLLQLRALATLDVISVAEVLGHLCLQGTLDHALGSCLSRPFSPSRSSGFL